MKSVAIYGFAPRTRDLINQSDAEEVWSLNNFYNYALSEDRVTRTFEMHELWIHHIWQLEIKGNRAGQAYWDWLREEHPFPIYMDKLRDDYIRAYYRIKDEYTSRTWDDTDVHDIENLHMLGIKLKEVEIGLEFFKGIKSTILKYPMDEIINFFFPVIPGVDTERFPERGVKPYIVSSIDYMTALAIYEGFQRIEYYGVELQEKTEWAMQKSGATYWIGQAQGRGIQVLTPKNSVLINAPLYGVEQGAQMIPIQVPEELKMLLAREFDRMRNTHNHLSGRFTTLVELYQAIEDKETDEAQKVKSEMDKVQAEANSAAVKMWLAEGGMNAMTHLIKNEDLSLDPINLQTMTRMEYVVEEAIEEEGKTVENYTVTYEHTK